ncbi:hypothetical protein [Aminobacter sp. DSM 101952]|uniref:hypothetical protein n=1 Tax=Aminobacter sp. DSM 101952 TaxID=2735891 RepID=UPI0012E3F897|nr:hypothetical protein [Aminobacter sp. DSM 101952]
MPSITFFFGLEPLIGKQVGSQASANPPTLELKGPNVMANQGTQGGSSEQHRKAGEQSHKNDGKDEKQKSSGTGSSSSGKGKEDDKRTGGSDSGRGNRK